MAQYDVYPNPSEASRARMPYVVVIQSDLLDALPTRLTVPLSKAQSDQPMPKLLCPVVKVKGKPFHALAHYAAPLPARLLRRSVGSIRDQASALVGAMDAVLSGF